MKHILTVVLIAITGIALGQVKVDHKIGAKNKDTRFTYIKTSAVTKDGEHIMLVKSMPKILGKGKQSLQLLDQNMNLVSDHEIDDIYIQKIVPLKNKSFFAYNYKNEKDLYLRQINEETFKGTGKAGKIMTIDKKELFPDIYVSKDSTKVAFVHTPKTKKKENERYNIGVFDQNMKKLWSRSYTLPERNKDFLINEFTVGNDGAIYLTGTVKDENRDFNTIKVCKITQNDEYTYVAQNLNEKSYVGELSLIDGNTEGIELLGFKYLNKKSSLSKIQLTKLNNQLDILEQKLNSVEFKDYIFHEDDKKKDKAKKEKKTKEAKEQRFLKIRSVIENADNSKIVVAEKFFIQYRSLYIPASNGTPGQWTYYKLYNYRDIVVMRLDGENNLTWAKKIPKKQRLIDYDKPLGITVNNSENNIYILFNDDARNLNKNKERLYLYSKDFINGVYKVVQVNKQNGEVKEDEVFNLREKGFYVEPKNYFTMKDGSTIVIGYKKKQNVMIKLSFPEN